MHESLLKTLGEKGLGRGGGGLRRARLVLLGEQELAAVGEQDLGEEDLVGEQDLALGEQDLGSLFKTASSRSQPQCSWLAISY